MTHKLITPIKKWGTWDDMSHVLKHHTNRSIYKAVANNAYSVQFSRFDSEVFGGQVIHLWIRRHDGKRFIPWAHFQRIKDQLAGKDWQAVQVYPKRDKIVDQADMYHLWCFQGDLSVSENGFEF